MSRIRSTHPEQWTDDDFVELSFAARLLTIAIRNECDDKGIFEWKPKRIKMRLFPCDNVDIDELLTEMVKFNQCIKYQADEKHYGAVRNFRKYQRPKTPNDIYPITDEVAEYVGLLKTISPKKPRKPPSFPPKGEKSPQMEDGGDKGKEESMSLLSKSDAPKSSNSRMKYSKEFEAFWLEALTTPNMSKKSAYTQWKRLDEQSRIDARASLPAFKTYMATAEHTPLHVERYLSRRTFDGFTKQHSVISFEDQQARLIAMRQAKQEAN